MEQSHVAAPVLEADEIRHVAREPFELFGAEHGAVARVHEHAEGGRVGDRRDVPKERVGIRMRVVRRHHEDPGGAGALRLARELRSDARTETDSRDHRDPAVRRVDGGRDDRGAFGGAEPEQLARAARRDERVDPARGEPPGVRAESLLVERAIRVVRRDREREHSA